MLLHDFESKDGPLKNVYQTGNALNPSIGTISSESPKSGLRRWNSERRASHQARVWMGTRHTPGLSHPAAGDRNSNSNCLPFLSKN